MNKRKYRHPTIIGTVEFFEEEEILPVNLLPYQEKVCWYVTN